MIRVLIARALYAAVVIPLSAISGTFGSSTEGRPKTNGLLILEARQDVRSEPARQLARRLGADPWLVYLFGVRLRVDTSMDPPSLLNESNAVIGSAVRVDVSRPLYEWRPWDGRPVRFYLYVG